MNGEKAARTAKATVTHLLLAGIGFVWIYPFIWMISASFKSQSEFFENRLGLALILDTHMKNMIENIELLQKKGRKSSGGLFSKKEEIKILSMVDHM